MVGFLTTGFEESREQGTCGSPWCLDVATKQAFSKNA
jgi:hypothetical protein